MRDQNMCNRLYMDYTAYKDLKSYLIDLAPQNIPLSLPIDTIPTNIFFEKYWFCDEKFVRLRPDLLCTLVYIPDNQAIKRNEFERHAIFLSLYFAWKHQNTIPESLEGYIMRYSLPTHLFFFDKDVRNLEIVIDKIQDTLANPYYKLPGYNKQDFQSAITDVFNATKKNGYYYNGGDIFSAQSLAILLGRLFKDGGETEHKVFYYLCHSKDDITRITNLYCVIKNLLRAFETISPKITFSLLVFCHFDRISTGSGLAEQLPPYDEYSLFEGPYYKSTHFLNNLDARIAQIAKYNARTDTVFELERTRKTEAQIRRIKYILENEEAIEQTRLSFHGLIGYVSAHWDNLLG